MLWKSSVELLTREQRRLASEGEYEKAKHVGEVIAALKAETAKTRKADLDKQHQRDLSDLEIKQRQRLSQFEADWAAKWTDAEKRRAKAVQDLAEKAKAECLETEKREWGLKEERKPRPSYKLLTLMEEERNARNAKDYKEAERISELVKAQEQVQTKRNRQLGKGKKKKKKVDG
jgi:hypothetical protein